MKRTNKAQAPPTSLRDARKRLGITGEGLAERLGVTRPSVSQWENGHTKPSGPARRLIAVVLDVPVDLVQSWFEAA